MSTFPDRLLKPEIFRWEGEEVDAQAEIEKLVTRLGGSYDYPDEARQAILARAQPRDFGRKNELHIGTSTMSHDKDDLFDWEAAQFWVSELPQSDSEGEFLLDRAGRVRLDAKGNPLKNRWFGIQAIGVMYQASTSNKSNRPGSEVVFPDNTNPADLYPGLIAWKSTAQAEAYLELIRACVRQLRLVRKMASGMPDVDPNTDDGTQDPDDAFREAS